MTDKHNDNYNFIYVSHALVKQYKKYACKALKGYGLTPAEIDIITFLVNQPPEVDTAKDIVKRRGLSKALVSKSIGSLVDKKLISLSLDEKDRRIVHLRLTSDADEIIGIVQESKKIFYMEMTKNIKDTHMKIFKNVNIALLENIKNINV